MKTIKNCSHTIFQGYMIYIRSYSFESSSVFFFFWLSLNFCTVSRGCCTCGLSIMLWTCNLKKLLFTEWPSQHPSLYTWESDTEWCCSGFRIKILITVFLLLMQNSVYTNPWIFLFLVLPCQQRAQDAQGAGKAHSQNSWPKLPRGIFHSTWHHSVIMLGEVGWVSYCSSRTGWVSVGW